MAVNVAVDSLCDAIVAKLTTELVPTVGQPVTTLKPAYLAQRYTGAEFKVDESFKRGIAGRTPALLVHHAGDKSIKTTVGRRVDRVESTIRVIVCTDAQTEKDRRSAIIDVTESVRNKIGARAFLLPIQPMRWQSTTTLHDSDSMLAIGVSFTTRHRVDYTVDPGADEIVTVGGEIEQGSVVVTIANEGTAGTSTWTYTVIALNADGDRVAAGSITTDTGAATLTGTNFNRLEWEALEEASTYQVLRTAHGTSPATDGLIATTAFLTVDDTGLAASSSPEPFSQGVEVDFT